MMRSHDSAPDYGALQRAFLLRLDELTTRQAAALKAGDLGGLQRYSEERAQAARMSASFCPPAVPWQAEVVDFAAEVGARTMSLQEAIRDCMIAIRRDLAQLSAQQRLTEYRDMDAPPAQRARWQG